MRVKVQTTKSSLHADTIKRLVKHALYGVNTTNWRITIVDKVPYEECYHPYIDKGEFPDWPLSLPDSKRVYFASAWMRKMYANLVEFETIDEACVYRFAKMCKHHQQLRESHKRSQHQREKFAMSNLNRYRKSVGRPPCAKIKQPNPFQGYKKPKKKLKPISPKIVRFQRLVDF